MRSRYFWRFRIYMEWIRTWRRHSARLSAVEWEDCARCAERSAGWFLVAGILYGYDDPGAREEKAAHYARIQELAKAFEEKNGSIVCRELLGLSVKREEPTPKERTAEYYKKRPCKELVGDAAEILEKYIAEHPVG